MRRKIQVPSDELRPEYNFDYSKAVRGKYYRRPLKRAQTSQCLNQTWLKRSATPRR